MTYHLLLLVHIMLLVFWLGTDVGVFVSAVYVKKFGRPIGERIVLVQVGALLDVGPRLCSALMLPVSVTLAESSWGLEASGALLTTLWVAGLAWCVAIVTAYRRHDKPIAAAIAKVQLVGLVMVGVAFIAWGVSLLGSDEVAPWLALKLVVLGLVYLIAIGIDAAYRPVPGLLAKMVAGGGDSADEEALRIATNNTLAVVLALYACVIAASVLGTLKIPH